MTASRKWPARVLTSQPASRLLRQGVESAQDVANGRGSSSMYLVTGVLTVAVPKTRLT